MNAPHSMMHSSSDDDDRSTEALKACGVIVHMEPQEFLLILDRIEAPLVVAATSGIFTTKYNYLTTYKGLAFYTKSKEPLSLGVDVEVIGARRIWMPE